MAGQLDLFTQPPSALSRAHSAEEVTQSYVPPEGSPEYKAAYELLKFIDYGKLNKWQREILWPHIRYIVEDILPTAERTGDVLRMRMELGYVIGSLEVDQIRARSEAVKICAKYGIEL